MSFNKLCLLVCELYCTQSTLKYINYADANRDVTLFLYLPVLAWSTLWDQYCPAHHPWRERGGDGHGLVIELFPVCNLINEVVRFGQWKLWFGPQWDEA